jgi:rare lipoprotein A
MKDIPASRARLREVFFITIALSAVEMSLPSYGQAVLKVETGKATWYGKGFHGKKTASGEKFHSDYPIGAHPTWPFGTVVRVTNLENNKALKVRIVDRGPSKRQRRKGVIIDLSLGAAKVLGFVKKGFAKVRVDVLTWGKGK